MKIVSLENACHEFQETYANYTPEFNTLRDMDTVLFRKKGNKKEENSTRFLQKLLAAGILYYN